MWNWGRTRSPAPALRAEPEPVERPAEVVLELVRAERLQRWSDLDALDAKAGIILAGAGALAVLAGPGPAALRVLGTLAALLAAGFAVWALRVKPHGFPEPSMVAAHYLDGSAEEAREALIEQEVKDHDRLRTAMQGKAKWFKKGYWTLVVAIGMLALSNVWEPVVAVGRLVATCWSSASDG